MVSAPSSSSRPCGPKKVSGRGAPYPMVSWRSCKHRDFFLLWIWFLFEQELPFSMAGLRLKISPIHPGGTSVLRPLSAKRCRISNSSIPPRASGVLWPPTAQLYSGFHPAHRGLHCPFASYSWVVRPILNFGEGYSASSRVITRNQYLKWGEPKYGASPRPDTYPTHQGRHSKSGLPNSSILRTSHF